MGAGSCFFGSVTPLPSTPLPCLSPTPIPTYSSANHLPLNAPPSFPSTAQLTLSPNLSPPAPPPPQLGCVLFGGKLTVDSWPEAHNQLYVYTNFNDFGSALVTLFYLLVVNNWYIAMESVSLLTSQWAKLYFISWYILAVVVMSNLVIAQAIRLSRVQPSDVLHPKHSHDRNHYHYACLNPRPNLILTLTLRSLRRSLMRSSTPTKRKSVLVPAPSVRRTKLRMHLCLWTKPSHRTIATLDCNSDAPEHDGCS